MQHQTLSVRAVGLLYHGATRGSCLLGGHDCGCCADAASVAPVAHGLGPARRAAGEARRMHSLGRGRCNRGSCPAHRPLRRGQTHRHTSEPRLLLQYRQQTRVLLVLWPAQTATLASRTTLPLDFLTSASSCSSLTLLSRQTHQLCFAAGTRESHSSIFSSRYTQSQKALFPTYCK